MAMIIRIDPELLEHSAGFSYDIGGSTAKIAYRSKTHHSGSKPKSKDFAGLVTVEFVNDVTVDKIVKLVKEKCDLTLGGECFSTGSGANKFQQTLQDRLRVNITNLSEGDTFVQAISSLGKAAKKASDIFSPKPSAAVAEAAQQIQQFMNFQASLKDHSSLTMDIKTSQTAVTTASPEVKYPHLMVTCGSSISFILVEKDGSQKFCGMTNLGGRAFMGLSKALTGAKDFEEVNAMMKGADGRTVDEWMSDIINPSSKSDMYSSMPGDIVVYRLGKLNRFSIAEVKKADVAQSLAALMAVNAATMTRLQCKALGVTTAYLCGNFVSKCSVFQHHFTTTFMVESALNASGEPATFEFLEHGGYLGALGALMNDSKRSIHF